MPIYLTDSAWTNKQKESKSNFQSIEQILVGRVHDGDENGQTKCKFATPVIDKQKLPEWVSDVVIRNTRTVEMKESKSDFRCNDGEVILGRIHNGDENGTTAYFVGELALALKVDEYVDLFARGCFVHTDCEEKTCKESDGDIMEVDGKCIVGRKHIGDENANTTYTFAKIAVALYNYEDQK